MNYSIDIQTACNDDIPVSKKTLKQWVKLVLLTYRPRAALTLRLVSPEEMQALNATYRKQDKPTNVLAFPSQVPASVRLRYPLLGDLIVCPAVLSNESQDKNIPLIAHWAHIVIHGVLHLLGFDHQATEDTARMQAEEIRFLASLNFANPYLLHEDHYLE